MPRLDHIEMDGVNYEFVDQNAREQISSLASREYGDEQRLTEAINTEKTRAMGVERALQDSKVGIESGKGLSSNDFTDEYKSLIDDPIEVSVNQKGVAPAPTLEDADKYLDGTGSWSVPHDTTYANATELSDGLMSKEDKTKLNGIDSDMDIDDYSSNHIDFDGNKVTQYLGNGKIIKTDLSDDGIVKKIYREGWQNQIVLNTTFNMDGSIDVVKTLVPPEE